MELQMAKRRRRTTKAAVTGRSPRRGAAAEDRTDSTVIELFHHRWMPPLLAELHCAKGGRIATLAHQLDASQASIRFAIRAAIEAGWVRPNPGSGHPLRPEYALTPAGASLAPACLALVDRLHERDLLDLGLRKWPMPVLRAIDRSHARFGELRRRLKVITDRALSQALKELHGAELIARDVSEGFPPVATYVARPDAKPLLQALRRL
jgi:DNA-binding HxlR family transcriptional regulator